MVFLPKFTRWGMMIPTCTYTHEYLHSIGGLPGSAGLDILKLKDDMAAA